MKIFLKLTLVLALFLSTTEAKTKTLPAVDQVIPAMDLTPETIQGLIAGLHPNVAIELKEGTSVPLHFLLNHKFFSMKCDPNLSIKITTPCYLRTVGKKLFLSVDLVGRDSPDSFFRGTLVPNVCVSSDKSHVIIETNFKEFDESEESSEELDMSDEHQ